MNAGIHEYPISSNGIADEPTATEQTTQLRRVTEALQFDTAQDRNDGVAQAVVDGLRELGRFYHIMEAPNFSTALYFDNKTKELDRVKSDRFEQKVSDLFALNRASPPWKYTERAIENASIGEGSTGIHPEAFWAARPEALYLSNGPGRMVRIHADGCELVDNGTDGVLFPRGSILDGWQLCEPRDPFESCELLRGLSATAGHGPLLAKLWTVALPTNPKNKPPLSLAGSIGSGKTRFALGLCELYGIPSEGRTIKIEENGEGNFWPLLDSGGIAILDNCDNRISWFVDALAAAATGAGQTKRKLYSDQELVRLRPRGWLVVTTARPDSFAGDPGLADRLLVVRMDRRRGETKDGELSAEIARNRDAGLSWICQTLRTALREKAEPPPELNRRHPDFGRWAFRIGRAIGLETETVAALKAAEADKSIFCLESDSVGTAVLGLLRTKDRFSGPARELLTELKSAELLEPESRLTAKGLGKRLDGLWPHLQQVVPASREKGRDGVMKYTIGKARPE